jgi:hypothetical protein
METLKRGEQVGSISVTASPFDLIITQLPDICLCNALEALLSHRLIDTDAQCNTSKADAFPDAAFTGLPASQQPPALSPHALQLRGLGSAVNPPYWLQGSPLLHVTARGRREVEERRTPYMK